MVFLSQGTPHMVQANRKLSSMLPGSKSSEMFGIRYHFEICWRSLL